MDYAQLIAEKQAEGSIRNWVNDTTIPSKTVLDEAQAWIFRFGRLRTRHMLATTPLTLAINTDTIALPTDFLGNVHLIFTGTTSGIPKFRDLPFVRSQWSWDANGNRTTGKPGYYSFDAANLQFEVLADQAYALSYLYYAEPAKLNGTTSGKTNFLTSEFPVIMRSACMAGANEFKKNDAEKKYWLQVCQAAIDKANIEDDLAKAGMVLDMQFEGP